MYLRATSINHTFAEVSLTVWYACLIAALRTNTGDSERVNNATVKSLKSMFSPYSSYFVGYEPFKLLSYNILMVPCPGNNSVRGFEFTFSCALYERRSWAVGCQLQIRGVPVSSTSLPNSTKPLSCRTGLIIKIFFSRFLGEYGA